MRETVCLLLLPTRTFPKAMLTGLATKVAVPVTPLPDRVSVCGELGALSVKRMVPLAGPRIAGANCALKEILWPAEIVAGKERPLTLKPLPETVARFTTRLVLPLLVTVTVWLLD